MSFRLNYPDPSSRFKIDLGDYEHHIIAMVFIADLSVDSQQIPILKVTEYRELETDRLISQSIQFEIVADDTTQGLALHKIIKGYEIYLTLSLNNVPL